jgi:hypothetical protein
VSGVFHICKAGSEVFCARELRFAGREVCGTGPGWVRCEALAADCEPRPFGPAGLCFPVMSLLDAVDIRADSVNAQAAALGRRFWEAYRGERVETPWLLEFIGPPDRELAARIRSVRRELLSRLARQAPRVARLAG